MAPSSPASCRPSIRTDAATKETSTICGKSAITLFLSTMLSRGSASTFGRFLNLPRLHSDAGRAATTAGAVISIYGPAAFFYLNEENCFVSKFFALKKFLCYNNYRKWERNLLTLLNPTHLCNGVGELHGVLRRRDHQPRLLHRSLGSTRPRSYLS